MKAEFLFALIGGIVGATIGQLKGGVIANHLATLIPERLQKVFRAFPFRKQTDNPID